MHVLVFGGVSKSAYATNIALLKLFAEITRASSVASSIIDQSGWESLIYLGGHLESSAQHWQEVGS